MGVSNLLVLVPHRIWNDAVDDVGRSCPVPFDRHRPIPIEWLDDFPPAHLVHPAPSRHVNGGHNRDRVAGYGGHQDADGRVDKLASLPVARSGNAEPRPRPLSSTGDRCGTRPSARNRRRLRPKLGPLWGAVERVIALDPSPEFLPLATRRVTQAPVPAVLVRGTAEQMPFPDATFDSAVMTWTLCSIPRPEAALAEMRRVLRPGGHIVFVEHGLSPEPVIARWQRRLTPCWSRLSGGCHLDRKADDLIRNAGFRLTGIETGYMRGPKPWTYMYQGTALAE